MKSTHVFRREKSCLETWTALFGESLLSRGGSLLLHFMGSLLLYFQRCTTQRPPGVGLDRSGFEEIDEGESLSGFVSTSGCIEGNNVFFQCFTKCTEVMRGNRTTQG